jgi:hypothetical protein
MARGSLEGAQAVQWRQAAGHGPSRPSFSKASTEKLSFVVGNNTRESRPRYLKGN